MVGAAHSFMPARLSLAGAAVDVESIGVSAAKVAINDDNIPTVAGLMNMAAAVSRTKRTCSVRADAQTFRKFWNYLSGLPPPELSAHAPTHQCKEARAARSKHARKGREAAMALVPAASEPLNSVSAQLFKKAGPGELRQVDIGKDYSGELELRNDGGHASKPMW
eukprot:scaffold117670_cov72-Phaeocystis_antarctica.AAC.1